MSQPLQNPLVYYAEHKPQIELLSDECALFLLSLLTYLGEATAAKLSFHAGLPEEEIESLCTQLCSSSFVEEVQDRPSDMRTYKISEQGRGELELLGFLVRADQSRRRRTSQRSILFVDDHEALARLSCEILESQGYRAVCAYSGEEALEKFRRERFDIVVTDFRMEGMNGLDLAKQIHATDPDVPVIIVTGYGPLDWTAHAQACLEKTSMFPALLEKIETYLGDSVAQPQKSKTG